MLKKFLPLELLLALVFLALGLAANKQSNLEHLKLGRNAFNNQNFEAALYHFGAILDRENLDSDVEAETLFYIGKTFQGLGFNQRAYESFRRLVWRYPASHFTRLSTRHGRIYSENLE